MEAKKMKMTNGNGDTRQYAASIEKGSVKSLSVKRKDPTGDDRNDNDNTDDLVVKENFDESMNGYFTSQGDGKMLSRRSTSGSEMTVNSDMTSVQVSCNTIAAVGSVEDLMTKLPVIDPNVVLCEWLTENEGGEEVEGVIPVGNNKVEVTQKSIEDLNNGQLEYIGGIKDHEGEFREWHEMTSLLSKDGEVLHILPYCIID